MDNNTHSPYHSKYLIYLAMLFITIKLLTVLTVYKIISIDGIVASASNLIIPAWFFVEDIIAEIYGFRTTNQLIAAVIILEVIFAFCLSILIKLHSPDFAVVPQSAYEAVFSNVPKVVIASILAIGAGGIFNAFILTKTKLLLSGKYFAIRSLIASGIGELIFTSVANIINFLGVMDLSVIIHIIIDSYIIKIIMNLILIIPTDVITRKIKRLERFIPYNVHTGLASSVIPDPNSPNTTKITRLFTGADNKTYFSDIDIEVPMKHELGYYSIKYPASGFKIREFSPGSTIEWHTSPNPRYIIYLSGEIKITVSSGEQRTFKSGDTLLAEDITGDGHTTTTIAGGRSIIIFT